MKKRRTFCFTSAFLAIALAFVIATPAGATLYEKTIKVFSGIKIYVDGVELIPTDANGSQVETFVYNGTTYVPLRAVSQALGKPVSYDGTTQTAYIGKVPGQDMYLQDVCPPYQTSYVKTLDYVTLAGSRYLDNMVFYSWNSWALYNLNGQFSTLEFDVGHIDGRNMQNATLNIYLDGDLAYTKDLTGEMLPTHAIVALNGALQMKIELKDGYGYDYAIVNATIE